MRTAQQASEPTAAELAEFRKNIEKASGRIRGLQATVAEHEKNIEALKKELAKWLPKRTQTLEAWFAPVLAGQWLPRALFRKSRYIAIDWHSIPYHGEPQRRSGAET